MKKLILTVLAAVTLAVPAAFAAEHAGHDMQTATSAKGLVVHEENIDGVKAVFMIQTMKDAMKEMHMEMPKGVRETHHISLKLVDTKSGKPVTSGEARLKVVAPDKSEQVKDMTAMHGHFGTDVVMTVKGKYGVLCKFKTADGKVRSAKFIYLVK